MVGGMGTLKVRTDLFGVLNIVDATDAGSGSSGRRPLYHDWE